LNALIAALVFAALVYVAISLCERASPPGDRTGTVASEALRLFLCASSAIVGGILVAHAATPESLFAIGILCAALGATCYLTTLDAVVPAVVPGTALAILIGAAVLNHDFGPLVSSVVTGAPFAATALVAKDSGADWRDSIVAALGGAAFGLQLGIVVVGIACIIIALARPYIARHRTRPQPPARFASALAATFLLVLLGQLAIS